MRSSRRIQLVLISAAWLLFVFIGFRKLMVYSQAAGVPAEASPRWPAGSALAHAGANPLLVVFAHPQCPCTAATIVELDRLMAQCQGHLSAEVVFIRPASMPAGWEKTALWRSAERIPGVTVVCDDTGSEADRFGASTSGQAFLYDTNGNLLFAGGITAARGHAGDNDGSNAIAAIVNGQSASKSVTPVYGCPIFNADHVRSNACNK